MRDFEHKHAGRGAVKQKQKPGRLVIAFVALVLFVVVVLIVIVTGSPTTSSDSEVADKPLEKKSDEVVNVKEEEVSPTNQQNEAVSSTNLPQIEPDITNTEETSDLTLQPLRPSAELPEVKKVDEPYSFYETLSRPPAPRDLPEIEALQSNRIYTVQSALLDSRERAYTLRARLVLEGFSPVRVVPTIYKETEVYRLVITNINSRSRMNKVRDLFAEEDVDSTYTFRQKR